MAWDYLPPSFYPCWLFCCPVGSECCRCTQAHLAQYSYQSQRGKGVYQAYQYQYCSPGTQPTTLSTWTQSSGAIIYLLFYFCSVLSRPIWLVSLPVSSTFTETRVSIFPGQNRNYSWSLGLFEPRSLGVGTLYKTRKLSCAKRDERILVKSNSQLRHRGSRATSPELGFTSLFIYYRFKLILFTMAFLQNICSWKLGLMLKELALFGKSKTHRTWPF